MSGRPILVLVFSSSLWAQSAAAISEQQATGLRQMQNSIDVQKAAAQTQRATTKNMTRSGSEAESVIMEPLFLPIVAVPEPVPVCDPMPESEAESLITSAAAAQQLDPALLREVIRKESRFQPCAVSAKGAEGLMQLLPETASEMRVAHPFDPTENVNAGARCLRQLLDRFHGDVKLALAAYNAGSARVSDEVPAFPETQDYVEQILKALSQ